MVYNLCSSLLGLLFPARFSGFSPKFSRDESVFEGQGNKQLCLRGFLSAAASMSCWSCSARTLAASAFLPWACRFLGGSQQGTPSPEQPAKVLRLKRLASVSRPLAPLLFSGVHEHRPLKLALPVVNLYFVQFGASGFPLNFLASSGRLLRMFCNLRSYCSEIIL